MTVVLNRPWLWGGILLVASAVAEFAFPPFLAGRGLVSALFLAAGVCLFALGGGVGRNIFGGDRFATVAAVLLSVLVIGTGIVGLLPDGVGPGWNQLWVGSAVGIARLVLTVVLVVQVGRSQALPARWRWAPLWAVALECVGWGVTQLVLINTGTAAGLATLWVTSWGSFVAVSVTIFIGILGILVAQPRHVPQVA